MKKSALMVCMILFVAGGVSQAETVFSEHFTNGAGHFSGFSANECQWQTPGDFETLLSYFGNGKYAEITKSGCVAPTFWDQIVSDTIDLSNYADSKISFEHYHHGASFTGVGNVEVSIDGGSTYSTVYTTTGDVTGATETIEIPIADGESNVKVRFYFWYYGGVLFDSYWGVDNVTVTATPVGDDDDNDNNDDDDDNDNDNDNDDNDDLTPGQPFIEVTAPMAEDIWLKGAEETITWNQDNPNGWNLRVALFKGGVYEGRRLCDNLPGNAVSCSYAVEQDIMNSDDYQVQVYFIDHGAQYSDFSSEFTITDTADDDTTDDDTSDDDTSDDDNNDNDNDNNDDDNDTTDDDSTDDDEVDDDDLADDDDDLSPNDDDDDTSDDDESDDDDETDGDGSGECGC